MVCANAFRDSTITPNRVYGVGQSLAQTVLPLARSTATGAYDNARYSASRVASDIGLHVGGAIYASAVISVGVVLAGLVQAQVISLTRAALLLGVVIVSVGLLLALLAYSLRRMARADLIDGELRVRGVVSQARDTLKSQLPTIAESAAAAYLEYSPPQSQPTTTF